MNLFCILFWKKNSSIHLTNRKFHSTGEGNVDSNANKNTKYWCCSICKKVLIVADLSWPFYGSGNWIIFMRFLCSLRTFSEEHSCEGQNVEQEHSNKDWWHHYPEKIRCKIFRALFFWIHILSPEIESIKMRVCLLLT